ncbi:Copper transport protein CCH [Raphanus sativus]|uniref:Copper transport protein CCH-like n=1 Tax=Raphanus sativus TaxID=3726 RepID=A0A9W3DJ23_RAPSA|nr:copper transport protein CCH-like [Raphanus sativus]KAJ4905124.1 Copper transport protein CCH [Raphanus sativus]
MSQTVVLKVGMSCQGCVGAVNRVLGKMEGVESFDIDIKEQKVTVKGKVEPEGVFQTVSKTGKKTSYWPVEAEVEPKDETETRPEGETKTEGKVDAEVPEVKVDAKVEPKADVEPKHAETETKTKGKVDDEILDAKVDTKVDAKADVEPKLVEAETKPPQV